MVVNDIHDHQRRMEAIEQARHGQVAGIDPEYRACGIDLFLGKDVPKEPGVTVDKPRAWPVVLVAVGRRRRVDEYPVHQLARVMFSTQLLQRSCVDPAILPRATVARSEEHTSELQSLLRIPYAVFCL